MATIGDKPITDFDDGSQYLDENSLFAMAYPKDGGYASGKISAGALGEGMGTQVNFSSLHTRNKNLFGAINELAAASNTIGVAVSGTLEAGETSITLSSSYIHTDSTIDVYTTEFGVNPTDMTVSEGSVILTFDEQASDLGVRIILRGYGVEGQSGGDGTKTTVLTDGYVSHNGAYTTATFDEDISDYDFVVLSFDDNGTDYINNFALAVNQIGQNGYDFAVQILGPVSMHITKTTIQATQYSGAWREIKCTVVAWKENAV